VESLDFDAGQHRTCIQRLEIEAADTKTSDPERGLFAIGWALIEKHARCSGWDTGRMREWAIWLGVDLFDPRLLHWVECSVALRVGRFPAFFAMRRSGSSP
jgi:hypothetical protein